MTQLVLPAVSRRINLLVIHCSASPNGRANTAADIDAWHRQRGFKRGARMMANYNYSTTLKHIGYHWAIRVDGVLESGRHPDEIGAHAAGRNARSLGVCLIGTDQFTPAQWETLATLVRACQETYPDIKSIVGHRDLPGVAKACPGFSARTWLDTDMNPRPEWVLR
jgi:N-acetylmuramoyl-L-alanine amidase